MMRSAGKLMMLLVPALTLAGCGDNGLTEVREWMDGVKKETRIIIPKISEPKLYVPVAYTGKDQIDPFNPNKLLAALAKIRAESDNGLKPDMNRRREALEAFPLDVLKMVGIIEKPNMKNALIQVDKSIYQAKIGNYVGQNFGMITKITDTDIEINTSKRSAMRFSFYARLTFVALLGLASSAFAQSNAIESITANQQGVNVIVKIAMKNPVSKPPLGFAITNPARIALDFADTSNGTGKSSSDIGMGDVRNVNVVEATGRSRLVFNLNKPLNYATTVEGSVVIVTIDGSGGIATAVNSSGLPVVSAPAAQTKQNLRDIDFRKGVAGEGRVVVDLPSSQVVVDVRQQGQKILVDFMKVGLPDMLRRRLDVTDFGSPIQTVTTAPQGENVRMTIEPKGLWEHSVYQSDTQLVIEVKPIKEDPNKLTQGTQGYRGERLSLNFQNIEVRALLQVIADFNGLNIITSDTVNGSLTLRLKDVPWDQALDIIMQS
ncbi:MAG: pilus assembly protein PilP, partial [Pseudomonadota bacterium]